MTPETLMKITNIHNVSDDYILELTNNSIPYEK